MMSSVSVLGGGRADAPPAVSPEFDDGAPTGIDVTLWRFATVDERTALLATARTEARQDTLIRHILRAGGSGTQADVDAVAAELRKLPVSALEALDAGHVGIVACRGSVTDYAADLRGVGPRGWPPGATWDSVPGAFLADRDTVVIATRGHGTPAGVHVPFTGDGHGSVNLVVHETTHAIDQHGGAATNSHGAAFTAARQADLAALPAYERQPGVAGPSETYAESAARYYGGTHGPVATPALDAYWAAHPLGGS